MTSEEWLKFKLDKIEKDIEDLKAEIRRIREYLYEQLPEKLSEMYVSKVEYAPAKALLWGLAVLILAGVVTAILSKVLVK